jgi:hypothetical protein
MVSSTLQTLQEPLLLTPCVCLRAGGSPKPLPTLALVLQGVCGLDFRPERRDERHPAHLLLDLLHVDAAAHPQVHPFECLRTLLKPYRTCRGP